MLSRYASAAVAALVVFAIGGNAVLAEENPVVAVVNGHKIHLSDVKGAHGRLPQQYKQVPFDTIYPGLIDSLIDVRLVAADARRQKLHESQEFKDQMARIEEQILQRMALTQVMKAKVTDQQVQARYDEVSKELAGAEQVKASHILLKTEDEAKKVIEELKKGGDFAKLAKEKSTGPSASDGGSLGFFGKGQMVPAFEKAAFALKKGAFTESAIKTQFGWHVIKVEDRKKTVVPGFKEVEQNMRNELSQEAGTAYIGELRKAADITRFNADGSAKKGDKPAAKK